MLTKKQLHQGDAFKDIERRQGRLIGWCKGGLTIYLKTDELFKEVNGAFEKPEAGNPDGEEI